MIIRIFLLFFLTLFASSSFAQNNLLVNAYNRPVMSLNGNWHYIVDPYENGYYNYRYEPFDKMKNPGKGAFFMNAKADDKTDLVEYNFDKSPTMEIPGDWNIQDEKLYYYEGTVWFKKSFDYSKTGKSNRVFIYFGAVNYEAEVYLNGSKLGTHIGGFTPFNFEVTNLLKQKDNFLILKVDNTRRKEGVPTLNTDWWNYGGITRDVKLVETPATFIRDYFIRLNTKNPALIEGYVKLDGDHPSNKKIKVSIPALGVKHETTTDNKGRAAIKIDTDNINYWSPDNPQLYQLTISTLSDTLVDQIGFRTIETEGDQILLNDKPVFLKGISIHEERPFEAGRIRTKEQARQLLEWAKELGCNYVRLAHYPHNEHMVVSLLHEPDRLFHDAPAEYVELSEAAMRACGRAVTERDFLTCHRFDVRDRLGAVDVPALAVVGAHDGLTPPAYHEFLAAEIPAGEWTEIPDAAHLAMLERPAAFNEALAAFLAER